MKWVVLTILSGLCILLFWEMSELRERAYVTRAVNDAQADEIEGLMRRVKALEAWRIASDPVAWGAIPLESKSRGATK